MYGIEKEQSIQNIILDLFKAFKEICKKHNLTYFAIGGTCLGAVRHKGFIPWDDDMDVAMPYEDYKKFIEIAEKELKFPYELFTPKKSQHYSNIFIKLHNSKTMFTEKFILPYSNTYVGVFLDIMPICGLPVTKFKRTLFSFYMDVLKRQNIQFRFPFNACKTLSEKIFFLSTLYAKLSYKPFFYFIKKIENQLIKYPINYSKYIFFAWRNSSFIGRHINYKQILEYKDFSSSIEVPFEDTTIAIPVGYDNYLKMDFGDYMKLPPEDKRIPRHCDAIIDLERPYSYYQEKLKKGEIK